MRTRDEEQSFAISEIKKELIESEGIALCIACTGYGKGELIRLISNSIKTSLLVVVPRVNLVRDLAQRTGGSIYCASLKEKNIGKVTIATKQSLKGVKADVVIVDEAHNASDEFLNSIDANYIIGLTATPFGDGGFIYGEDKFWGEPCYNFPTKNGIEAGYLCDFKIYGSQIAFDLSAVKNAKRDFTATEINRIISQDKHILQVKEFVEICNKAERKKVVVLCANIEHAEKIQSEILNYEECDIIHSKIKNSNDIVEDYKHNDTRFCVSVMMLSEGFDCPPIDAVIFLRPTRSSRLMVQASGRGLRLYQDKEYCLMLDYGSVFINCGLPTSPIINTEKKSETQTSEVICCESCFYIYDIKGPCPSCGHEKEPEKRDVDKNLLESIDKPNPFVIIDRGNRFKPGRTSKGAQYVTIESEQGNFTLFGWQCKRFYSLLSKGEIKLTYQWPVGSKFSKVLGLESHRPSE